MVGGTRYKLLRFHKICGFILNNQRKCGAVRTGQLRVDVAMGDDGTMLGICDVCRMQNVDVA